MTAVKRLQVGAAAHKTDPERSLGDDHAVKIEIIRTIPLLKIMIFDAVQRPHIHIHADDFGLSPSINRHIMECVEAGVLNGVSMMANGHALAEALDFVRSKPALHISVHLNFLEGKPLSDSRHPLLTDTDGDLRGNFREWWNAVRSMSPAEKEVFSAVIREESAAQIDKIDTGLKGFSLKIDSHQHMHMIPLVWDAITEVMHEKSLQHIRVPREPFFVPQWSFKYIRTAFGINFLKQQLLNSLSAKALKKIHTSDLLTPQPFCGVLYTGKMDQLIVKKFREKQPADDAEVLFHPGKADETEKHYWKKYPVLWAYYTSPDREKEKQELLAMTLPGG